MGIFKSVNNSIYKLIFAIATGLILGVVCARFFSSPLDLIPWTVGGLFLGFLSNNKKQALFLGGVYGFILSFSFMAGVYQGNAPILTRTPFFTILGIFGGFCGIILGLLGNLGKRLKK